MPGIILDPGDAAELAETLAFLADWLSGSQKRPRPVGSRLMMTRQKRQRNGGWR